jgi:hypothetical protein
MLRSPFENPSSTRLYRYTTTVAMHHHNVVGYHGGDPFSIAGSYRVQPSLSDSSNGQNGGVDVWFWRGIHDYLL